MNWDRAKTMLIICLLGLNAFLAAMYFAYDDDYVVSHDDVSVIVDILAANGIYLSRPHEVEVPRRHAPVDQLVLGPAVYNTGQLLNAFFTDTSDISQTIEFGNTIFSSPEGTLTIMRHIARFQPSPYAARGRFFSDCTGETPAQLEFKRFVRNNAQLFPGFELDHVHGDIRHGGVVYEFRQNYMGHTILPNKLSFTLGRNGVTEVLYVYYPPAGFVGVLQPIISAPQALFMFKLGSAHIDGPITITHIDLVQNLVFAADGTGRITTAPYYRIFSGQAEPMLINAVTGDIE